MAARIARADKNEMRARIEEILTLYKDINEKIESYTAQVGVEEYKNFWQELMNDNRRITGQISRYMVTKCNR